MGNHKFTDFYSAYNWLECHPIFGGLFSKALDIEVVLVDPKTNKIEDDKDRNTKTRVWLETGPVERDLPSGRPEYCHDVALDCGGDTFEEAICALANLVLDKYGYYAITEH